MERECIGTIDRWMTKQQQQQQKKNVCFDILWVEIKD